MKAPPIVFFALCCAGVPSAWAEADKTAPRVDVAHIENTAEREEAIEEVTVIGTRSATTPFQIPQAVSQLKRTQIRDASSRTTPEALAYVPGVHLQKTAHGHGSPFIRGLTGKQVLILVDGVRLNNSAYRFGPNQYLATVGLNSVQRIEVLRGPASVLYGSDALGGVINIITDTESTHTGSEFKSTFGSADTERSVGVNTLQNWHNWHLSAGASSHQYAAVRGGGDIGEQHHTGYDEHAWYLNLKRDTGTGSRFGIRLQHSDQSDVPRTDKYVNDFERYLFTDQSRAAATVWWHQPLYRSYADSVEMNLQAQSQHERFTRQKFNADSIRMVEDTIDTIGFTTQLNKQVGTNHLVYGAEFYRDSVDSRGSRRSPEAVSITPGSFPDDSRYYSGAVFAEYQMPLRETIDVSIGLRHSQFKVNAELLNFGKLEEQYNNTTGSLRVSAKLSDSMRLFGGIASGFRAPNLDDLVVLKSTNEGIDAPSPDLEPEQALNYEIGLKHNNGLWQSTLVAFYTDFENLIERRPGIYQGLDFFDENNNNQRDSGEETVVQKFNLGSAEIYGLELDAQLQLADTWMLSATFAYLYGRNETGDEPLSRIPPLNSTLRLRKTASSGRWWGELLMHTARRQDRLSARDVSDPRIPADGTPGYLEFSLFGGWQINQQHQLIWAINNLTDQKYKTHGSGLYEPGASAKLTYIMDLKR